MIERLGKTPHAATKEDIRWFWKDMDLDSEESYALAKEEVGKEELLIKWNDQYPFELTEWLMEWYTYMPEALSLHLDKTGPIDWNLFFSLIEPINTRGVPFICLVKALNVRQNQIVREQIYDTITKDPVLSKKVLNYQPIPSIYTHYTPYGKIHREVVRRLRVVQKAPSGSLSTFKVIERLTREGRSFEEALEEVKSCVT